MSEQSEFDECGSAGTSERDHRAAVSREAARLGAGAGAPAQPALDSGRIPSAFDHGRSHSPGEAAGREAASRIDLSSSREHDPKQRADAVSDVGDAGMDATLPLRESARCQPREFWT